MNTRKIAVHLFILACFSGLTTLHAQYLQESGTSQYNTSPYASPDNIEFLSDGTFFAVGPYTGTRDTLSSGASGPGTRLLWYPKLAAFRAGEVDGYQWDDDTVGSTVYANIGLYSVAFGSDTTASGSFSSAFGWSTNATGSYSTAFGGINTAAGNYSTVFGLGNTASQLYSTSFGHSTQANGYYSTSFGYTTIAQADASTVFGSYNLGGGNSTTWVSSDPLFEIGNGSSSAHSDALLVDKAGDVTASGASTATTFTTTANPPANDIPMYNGTN